MSQTIINILLWGAVSLLAIAIALYIIPAMVRLVRNGFAMGQAIESHYIMIDMILRELPGPVRERITSSHNWKLALEMREHKEKDAIKPT
jgi:hypothetical protein